MIVKGNDEWLMITKRGHARQKSLRRHWHALAEQPAIMMIMVGQTISACPSSTVYNHLLLEPQYANVITHCITVIIAASRLFQQQCDQRTSMCTSDVAEVGGSFPCLTADGLPNRADYSPERCYARTIAQAPTRGVTTNRCQSNDPLYFYIDGMIAGDHRSAVYFVTNATAIAVSSIGDFKASAKPFDGCHRRIVHVAVEWYMYIYDEHQQ